MNKFRNKIKSIGKTALLCWSLAFIILLAGLSVKIARAEWREPESAPPNETFYAPLSANGDNQVKQGFLQLDPNYSPTEDNSLFFSPQKPLDVRGEGAKFSTQNVYADKLAVDTDTLYATTLNDWVGIGTSTFTSGIKLKVEGGTVRVGTSSTPITAGTAVSGYSSDSVGVAGEAGATGAAGVYGLYTGTGGQAAKGESQNNAGVKGESESGAGIYATTQSTSNAAVYARNSSTGWAGYFSGRLGSGADIVSQQFFPTALQRFLVPFVSGQKILNKNISIWSGSNTASLVYAFDGTYMWAASGTRGGTPFKNLFKLDSATGDVIDSYYLGSGGLSAIRFDGKYLWATTGGTLYRFNPASAEIKTVLSTVGPTYSSLAVSSSIDGKRFIWITMISTTDADEGVWKINVENPDVEQTFYGFDALFNPVGGDLHNPMLNALAYDSSYIWIAGSTSGYMGRIWADDPLDAGHTPLAFDGRPYYCFPRSVYFDGTYIWCGPDAGTNLRMLRLWPANPTDPQHPPENFGPVMTYAKAIASDGTYLWVTDRTLPILHRFLLANPAEYMQVSTELYLDEVLAFDGTHLWLSSRASNPPNMLKYFSGTGMGQTDLNSLLNLNPAQTQTGSMNIGGNGVVGGATTVTGDIQAEANQWGGSDTTVNISGGTATCPDGQFMKSIIVGSDNKISGIVCRQL